MTDVAQRREFDVETAAWPALPYEDWRETRDTLHMYTQVIGKLRLALCPFEPQWANVPLYLTARGLNTTLMPAGPRSFDAEFDFVDHVLVMRSSDGVVTRRPLGGPVADFYASVMSDLETLDVDVTFSVLPSEVTDPIRFPEDRSHRTYDPEFARRFWRVLSSIDAVLKEHRARFSGRTTPVQFFWGTFDLALARFSGRPASMGAKAGIIERLSGNAELIAAGWWPGDERHPSPAFYAYAHPKPEGVERAAILGPKAGWDANAGEFLMPYSAVQAAVDPRAAIVDFLDSTYRVGAKLLGWPDELTEVESPTRE